MGINGAEMKAPARIVPKEKPPVPGSKTSSEKQVIDPKIKEAKPKKTDKDSKAVDSKDLEKTNNVLEEDSAFKAVFEQEKAEADNKAKEINGDVVVLRNTWNRLLKENPDKVKDYADQGNEDAKAALKRQRRRERYAEKKREAEASNATPLKPELVPDLDDSITFLTPDQKARRDELKTKSEPTTSEKNELNSLNAADPFKQYEKLQERLGKDEVLNADEQAFADKFEKTEEYESKLKTKKAAEDLEDLLNDERAGLVDSHGVFEILASNGDVGVKFEVVGRKLAASPKVEDKAIGLDMQYEGLLIQRAELQKTQDAEGKPLSSKDLEKNALELNQVEAKIVDTLDKRQKITLSNPELAENQFAGIARALVPPEALQSDSGNVLSLKSMHDYFDKLTEVSGDIRVGVLKSWKDSGVPDKVIESLHQVLFRKELADNHKDKMKGGVKKIGLVAALLLVLSVWAAAKKAGADGQMGGR